MTAHLNPARPSPDRIIEANRPTLADMQATRRTYQMQADRADWNNEPGAALMWQRMADDEDDRIALHMSRIAHGAADAQDVPDEMQRVQSRIVASIREAGWKGIAKVAAVSVAVVLTVLYGAWLTAWLMVLVGGIVT